LIARRIAATLRAHAFQFRYKINLVVRVVFKDGKPAAVEDFVTGWMKDGQALGRPAGLITGVDGALYISDDNKGFIYRVSYGEK